MEVKRKAIGVALEMVSSRNVEEVVLFLKKQLQGTLDQDFDKASCHDLTISLSNTLAEPRIPTTSYSKHPLLRHSFL